MTLRVCTICLVIFAAISPASKADPALRVGRLACNVNGNENSLVTLSKNVQCDYWPMHGDAEHFTGNISNLTVSPGKVGDGVMSWDVIAPAADIDRHVVAGSYGRLEPPTPQGTPGTLVGGLNESVVLRPIAHSGDASFVKFALGAGGLLLWPDSQAETARLGRMERLEQNLN